MSALTPVGMDSNGQAHIAGAADTIKVTLGSLQTAGNTPTIVVQSAAGTGATATITGTNLAGTITINTGLSLLAIGAVLTFTFADSFTFPNGCSITFSSGNANFAGQLTKIYSTPNITGSVCNGATVYVTTALSVSSAYTGTYHIVGW